MNIEQEIETEFANQVSTQRRSILTFDEALDNVLQENSANVLSNWSTDNLSALLTNIMKFFLFKFLVMFIK